MMKRRVEYADVWHSGEQFPHFANPRDDHWIMQRRERIELLHLGDQFISQQRRLGEFFTTVNNAMRQYAHFTRAADNSSLFRSKFRNHRVKGSRVISFLQVTLHFTLRSAMF